MMGKFTLTKQIFHQKFRPNFFLKIQTQEILTFTIESHNEQVFNYLLNFCCYFPGRGGDRRGRGGQDRRSGGGSGCFKCGEEGHFSKECPNASQGGNFQNKYLYKQNKFGVGMAQFQLHDSQYSMASCGVSYCESKHLGLAMSRIINLHLVLDTHP